MASKPYGGKTCGFRSNADINSAINIENRVVSTVLRNELLKNNKIGNGSYEPKIIKRDKVKELLLSFRYNLDEDSDRDKHHEFLEMKTFDYV